MGWNFNQKLENLPNSLQSLTFEGIFNQKLENLPRKLQSLTLGFNFNQKLENLSKNLKELTLGYYFNQKLENLPNSLQTLTLGHNFKQKLDLCIALPRLQILIVHKKYNLEIPPLFNTTIIYVSRLGQINKKIYENYENYNIIVWKNVFYKSINIK